MRRVTHCSLSSAEIPELETFAQVRSLKGAERLGTIYELAVELVTRDRPLDASGILVVPLSLELTVEGMDTRRLIHGIAAQVTDHLTTESRTPIYRLRFVPRLWRLTLTRTTEIFMDLTVPEVITAKLERAGLVQGTDFELRLHASYPQREYIVQYDETDLSFIQRLAEHIGITLFFEQDEEHERVVFADQNEAFAALPQGGAARFFPRGDERGIFELKSTTSTLPARYVVKDYNYRTPQVPLLGDASLPEAGTGLVYEYGGHFKTPDEAEQLSRVRAEEAACRRVVFEGSADDVRLAPGAKLKLEGHPFGEPELLITRVDHDFTDVTFLHGGTGDEQSYRSRFEAVLFEPPYRPARTTPKPRIHGCITAQIESGHDSPYAELDEEGRYHVRFLFDVTDTSRGKATRLVRMAQPHTGPGYGFHFPLRHGVEVLITFIDGDPDRPIISAAVPNPQTPNVVGSGNGTRNIIRTGAGNEINIDDTEGGERIKISTPYGGSTFQLGAPNLPGAGAALNTSDSWNAVAGSAATTASSAVSVFSDIASLFASADIIAFAGPSNIKDALMKKGPAIVKGAADVVDGALDTWDKFESAEIADSQQKAQVAREKAAEARAEMEKVDPDTDYETWKAHNAEMAKYDNEASGHERAVADLEQHKAGSDQTRDDIKNLTGWTKKASGLEGGGYDLADKVKNRKGKDAERDRAANKGAAEQGKNPDDWSKAADAAGKAGGGTAASAAAIAAISGGGFAAVGRIPGTVPAPGTPKNVQAAVNSAALVGLVNALVAGVNSAVVGKAQAVLAAGGMALVKSPGAAEVAGMARTLMTSGALIDLFSGGKIVTAAGASSEHKAGGQMKFLAGGRVRVTAGGDLEMSTTGQAKLSAASKADVTAGAALNLRGADVNAKAKANLLADAGGKATIKAGGDVSIKGAKVKCAGSGANLSLTGAADLKSNGNVLVSGGGPTTIKGSSVRLKGGPIELSGPVIKAKGRCLLG